jgi:hypothetical protein
MLQRTGEGRRVIGATNLCGTSFAPAKFSKVTFLFHIEADLDLGIAARVLDLLVTHDRVPNSFRLEREAERFLLTMEFDSFAEDRAAALVRKISACPGVRNAVTLGG